MKDRVAVAIERGDKRVFATASDWPGWSRSGRTDAAALEALRAASGRYRVVARAAGERFPTEATIELDVVEEHEGGAGTDFGVPSVITDHDRRPTSNAQAGRLVRLVDAAWRAFDDVAATAPPELRKGPRGGGRDRDKMIDHVLEADHAYAREIGIRVPAPSRGNREAVRALRAAVLEVIGRASDGAPLAGRRWPARYAATRIAWHALDHAWEMEDRSEPG